MASLDEEPVHCVATAIKDESVEFQVGPTVGETIVTSVEDGSPIRAATSVYNVHRGIPISFVDDPSVGRPVPRQVEATGPVVGTALDADHVSRLGRVGCALEGLGGQGAGAGATVISRGRSM